jgi:ectoine hydroxylase-related dioxygenase (phytanoyl-CoA dioxygenase family)
MSAIPEKSYGVLHQTSCANHLDEVVEQVTQLGYAVLDAGLSAQEVSDVANEFARIHTLYLEKYGEAALRAVNEHNTIRGMVTHGSDIILNLAMNANLMTVLKRLIPGKFILNQQNGIINPPKEGYNQGSWHRDIPYQHYVSSRPIAINALYCVDDFTLANGATFVLPATHLKEPYPSPQFIQRHAIQAEAKAGSFIVLDCMVYHRVDITAPTRHVAPSITCTIFRFSSNRSTSPIACLICRFRRKPRSYLGIRMLSHARSMII